MLLKMILYKYFTNIDAFEDEDLENEDETLGSSFGGTLGSSLGETLGSFLGEGKLPW